MTAVAISKRHSVRVSCLNEIHPADNRYPKRKRTTGLEEAQFWIWKSKFSDVARLERAVCKDSKRTPPLPHTGFICRRPPQRWARVHCTPCTPYCYVTEQILSKFDVTDLPAQSPMSCDNLGKPTVLTFKNTV